MKVRQRLIAFFAIGSLFSIASFAQQVKTDYDRNIDFHQYKTYSWGKIHTENQLWAIDLGAVPFDERQAVNGNQQRLGDPGTASMKSESVDGKHLSIE